MFYEVLDSNNHTIAYVRDPKDAESMLARYTASFMRICPDLLAVVKDFRLTLRSDPQGGSSIVGTLAAPGWENEG